MCMSRVRISSSTQPYIQMPVVVFQVVLARDTLPIKHDRAYILQSIQAGVRADEK